MIYCIKYYLGKNKHRTFVFVGNVDEPIKTMLQKGGADDKRGLKKVFGKDYKAQLRLGESNVTYIYEHINGDDTVGTVLNKIYTFTNISADFLWCRTNVHHKSFKMNQLVKYIMGGKKFIPFSEIQGKVNNIFTSVALEEREYYTAVDLLLELSKNAESIIAQPIGCSLHDGSNDVVFSANPYSKHAIFPKNPDLVEKVTRNDFLLSFYTPLDNEIRMVTKDSGVNNLYSTFKHSIYKTLRESNLPKYNDTPKRSVLNISYLHLKVNENSIHSTNLLHRCFEEITLNYDIPFVRLHKNSTTLFKIHKPSFTDPNMDLKKTQQWFHTASNNFAGNTTPRDEHLVFKFRISNFLGFFTVVIHNDLSYDVKFVFKRDDDINEEYIPALLSKVNTKLKEIRMLLDNHFIPDMSLTFNVESQYQTSTIIKDFIYYTTIEKTMFKLSEMKESIASMPRIASLVDNNNNVIHFVYKRIDNFSSNEKIKFFTNIIKSKNPNLSNSDIKKQIASYFDLEMEDVEKRFDDITTELVEYQRYVSRKHISVKIKLSDTKGVFVYIDGTHSSRVDHDILKNIYDFIDFITTHKTKAPHKEEEILYFDEDLDLENIEIDEEFQNMLNNLIENDGNNEMGDEDTNVDVEDAPHRFLLKNLYKADRKLFNTKDKAYSKMCQLASGRQPVAISDDENRYIGDNHKDAFNGSVRYGSSKNTQNNYICPRIWCPLTRVPLTQEQYVAAGYKCPTVVKNGKTINFNEKPIFQDSENYWGKDNKKPRYPGFLSPTKHPEGLCMPCCFSSKQQKWNKCLINAPATDKINKLSRNNEKYIMDFETNPTDVNRFSLLPQPFHSFFGNTKCGHRNNGTGLITTTTNDCVVKKGIPKSEFPLFECFASVLDNPSLKSAEDVVKSICDNLTTLEFVSLNCGTLVRHFIPTDIFKHAGDKTLTHFKKWAKSSVDYFNRMNIKHVYTKILSLRESIDKKGDEDILREFVVYSSYSNFITNIRKYQNASLFVELVNLKKSWLNASGINVVFLFSELYCRLPVYRSFEEIYDASVDWTFIQEFDDMYEPVCSITSKTPSEFEAIYRFPTDTKSALKNIIQNITITTQTRDLYDILTQMDTVKTILVVVSPDFRAMGFFVNSSMYVPYPLNESWNSMMNFQDEEFIHVQDVYSSGTLASETRYTKLFKSLDEQYNNQGLFKLIKDDDHIRLDCGVIIPTKQLVKSSKHIETFIDDKNIFIGLALPDIRLDYMNVLESKTRMYNTFKNEILALIKEDSNIQKEVYYSRHPYNPYPRHYIVERLKKTMDVFRRRILEGDVGKLELTNGPCVKNSGKGSCEKHGKCVFDDDECKLRIPIGMFDDFMDNFANELTQEDNMVEANVIKHEQPDDILLLSNIDMISSSNDVLMEQLYPKIYE